MLSTVYHLLLYEYVLELATGLTIYIYIYLPDHMSIKTIPVWSDFINKYIYGHQLMIVNIEKELHSYELL